MKWSWSAYLCIITLILSSPVIRAELANQQGSSTSNTNSTAPPTSTTKVACTQAQADANKNIREYCASKWEEWGVSPAPGESELRPHNECTNSAIEVTGDFFQGCGEMAFALPTLVGSMAARGIAGAVAAPNPGSPAHTLMYGGEAELKAHFTKEFFRTHCDGLADKRDEDLLHREICFTHPNEPKNVAGCELFQKRVAAARTCRGSAETRKLYRAQADLINKQAQQVLSERKEQEKIAQQNKSHLEFVNRECGPIMNPHKKALGHVISNGQHMYQAIKNASFPNEGKINQYNQCIADRTQGNDELRQRLQRSSASIVDQMVGQVQAVKCYKKEIRQQLYCQVARTIMTGGMSVAANLASRIGKNAVLKLQRKKINEIKNLSGDAKGEMLRRADRLTDSQRIAAAEKVLNRRLTPDQQKALLQAHNVGLSEGRGFGTFTRQDFNEKAEILRKAGMTREERELLMRQGVAGQSSTRRTSLPTTARGNATPEELRAHYEESLRGEPLDFSMDVLNYKGVERASFTYNSGQKHRLAGGASLGSGKIKEAQGHFATAAQRMRQGLDEMPQPLRERRRFSELSEMQALSGNIERGVKTEMRYLSNIPDPTAKRAALMERIDELGRTLLGGSSKSAVYQNLQTSRLRLHLYEEARKISPNIDQADYKRVLRSVEDLESQARKLGM